MKLGLCTPKKPFVIFLIFMALSKAAASEVIISGFPLGGRLEADKATKIVPFKEIGPGWKSYLFEQSSFFDFSEALTDDGLTIHALSFEKRYEISVFNLAVTRDRIKDDFEQLKKVLENKYGYFDTDNATALMGDKSKQNMFWLSAIEQFIVIEAPTDGIAQIRLSLSAPALDLEKPEVERKISLSLMFLDSKLVDTLKALELERFSGF